MQNSFSSPREPYEGTVRGEKTDKKQTALPQNMVFNIKIGYKMDLKSKLYS